MTGSRAGGVTYQASAGTLLRNADILRRVEEGATYKTLAREYRITEQRIGQIVQRARQADPSRCKHDGKHLRFRKLTVDGALCLCEGCDHDVIVDKDGSVTVVA